MSKRFSKEFAEAYGERLGELIKRKGYKRLDDFIKGLDQFLKTDKGLELLQKIHFLDLKFVYPTVSSWTRGRTTIGPAHFAVIAVFLDLSQTEALWLISPVLLKLKSGSSSTGRGDSNTRIIINYFS